MMPAPHCRYIDDFDDIFDDVKTKRPILVERSFAVACFALVAEALICAVFCSPKLVLGSHVAKASLHVSTNQLALGLPTLRVCSRRGLSVPCSKKYLFHWVVRLYECVQCVVYPCPVQKVFVSLGRPMEPSRCGPVR